MLLLLMFVIVAVIVARVVILARDTLSSLDEMMSPSSSMMRTPRDTKLSVGVASYTPGSLLKVILNWCKPHSNGYVILIVM